MTTKDRKNILIMGVAVAAAGATGYFLFSGKTENTLEAGPRILAAGTVEAIGEGKDIARQIGTVFVILRDETPGPPYAVTKLQNQSGSNTLTFALTEEHVMIPGRPVPTKPQLKIRFDSDGDPLTELPQDIIATHSNFAVGAKNLQLSAQLLGSAAK